VNPDSADNSSEGLPLFKAAWGPRIVGGTCIMLALYFRNLALDFPAGGGILPIFTMGGIIFLSIILIVASFRTKYAAGEKMLHLDVSYNGLKPPILIMLWVLYIISITEIGYFVSSIAFLYITTYAAGIRNFKAVTITGIILFPSIYAFFVFLLHAQLPQGILF
jgi:hypothetical protein